MLTANQSAVTKEDLQTHRSRREKRTVALTSAPSSSNCCTMSRSACSQATVSAVSSACCIGGRSMSKLWRSRIECARAQSLKCTAARMLSSSSRDCCSAVWRLMRKCTMSAWPRIAAKTTVGRSKSHGVSSLYRIESAVKSA